MTIQDVINNLDNTIRGKSELLTLALSNNAESIVTEFLRINIDELTRIREDLVMVKDKS